MQHLMDETENRETAVLSRLPLKLDNKNDAAAADGVSCTVCHQIEAEGLGTPIVGDGKYGGQAAFLTGSVSRKLHLHARSIALPHPSGKGELRVKAKLPPHMRETWEFFGLDPETDIDPFEE